MVVIEYLQADILILDVISSTSIFIFNVQISNSYSKIIFQIRCQTKKSYYKSKTKAQSVKYYLHLLNQQRKHVYTIIESYACDINRTLGKISINTDIQDHIISRLMVCMTDMTIENFEHLVSIVNSAHAGHIQQIVYL